MKLAIILGTRPEIIKMAPVIRACQTAGVSFTLIHTGQHYSANMDAQFFSELELPAPQHNLNLHFLGYREQLGHMVEGLEPLLRAERPDVVVVQGDTTSVLAGALAAKRCGIPVAHHEAGLRSNDLHMLEEVNRIITDSVSEIFFCPTEVAAQNLLQEGYPKGRMHITGNTIVDAVHQHRTFAERSTVLVKHQLQSQRYVLLTLHRAENVDHPDRLQRILAGIDAVHTALNLPVLFTIHPRTRKRLQELSLMLPRGVVPIDPVGFLDFLQLEQHAALILTDSGGAQEEACILGVPCVTLRDTTERPETVDIGANALVGADSQAILTAAQRMVGKRNGWQSPFGDGHAGERIVQVLVKQFS